jgi:predicted NBD/HSP70 family sugar kinase
MKQVTTKKERDKAVILEVVRQAGPMSRMEIQRVTRLRPTSVSGLVRELLGEGRLLEAGRSDNPMGRKQILLRLNQEYGYVLGVEFTAELVIAAALDLGLTVRSLVREPTALERGREGLVQQLLACGQRALDDAGVQRDLLLGIGVADPGLIDSRRGISLVSSTMEFWKNVPLKQVFEERFGADCFLESDTRARTRAERTCGVGADDMVYVEYSAGIGAGLVCRGVLLSGFLESAGEFGHTHMVVDGPPCNCGSFGCLEALAGAPAIAARARKAIVEGSSSEVLRLAGGDLAGITAWKVLEAARNGDKMCLAIVEDLGEYLGLGIANLVNLLNPELVVLDPRLELAGPGLLDHIVRVVRRQALRHSTERLVFRYGHLREEAGVLGAALIVVEELFGIPVLKPPQFLLELQGRTAARGGATPSSPGPAPATPTKQKIGENYGT